MNVRAIFIDMDGTLLKASNTISHRNMNAIYKLAERGFKVFLATGRHYDITVPYHREIGLQTPMICLNGAAIHDAVTGEATQTRTIQLNEERFHSLITEKPCNVLVHTATGLYCKETNEEIDAWTKVGKTQPRYVGDLRKANYQDVLKYSIRTGVPSPELSILFKGEAQVVDWDDGFELVAPHTSKWSAIQSLLAEFDISPDEVMTFGDGPNDLEMLHHAGIGVAMGNASDKVKSAADYVTEHHENDGLAKFLERHLLKSYESHAI